MTKLQYPFDYSDLEPAAAEVARDDIRPGTYLTTQDVQAEAFAYSQAISLKRIADALEKIEHHLTPVVSGQDTIKVRGVDRDINEFLPPAGNELEVKI